MRRRHSIVADSSLRPSRSFASLARQISGWTTNLLATAIVAVGGLALCWQVLFWWHEQPQPAAGPSEGFLAAADLLPTAGREFWTKHGPLKVKQVRGGLDDAVAAMRAFCRGIQPPQNSAAADGSPRLRRGSAATEWRPAAGPGEEQFLAQLGRQTPLEEAGDLSLYQPPGQLTMVVAVSRSRGRIVGWSFALPAREGAWMLYHFRPQSAGAITSNAAAQSAQPIGGGGP